MTNQSNLQTAEEIKQAVISKILDEANGSWKDIAEDVYDAGYNAAMESYASQSLPQQPVSAGLRWVKDGSVLFADWINKNHVVQNYVGDWLWNFLGKHYTTAELYDVFLEDSKKYPTPPTK